MTTCRGGAERALKGEVARLRPDWRPAYMRRGFLTFKCPATVTDDDVFATDLGFARRLAIPLGTVGPVPSSERAISGDSDERTAAVWKLAESLVPGPAHVHVWQRDGALRPEKPSAAAVSEDGAEAEPLPSAAVKDDPVARYLDEVRESLARTAPPRLPPWPPRKRKRHASMATSCSMCVSCRPRNGEWGGTARSARAAIGRGVCSRKRCRTMRCRAVT